MLKGHIPLSGKVSHYLVTKDFYKISAQCYVNVFRYRDFVQVLPICSVQVPAGRRINSVGLAFARKAILRQNTSDHAIYQLRPPFPLNNSKILGKKSYNPSKRLKLDSV